MGLFSLINRDTITSTIPEVASSSLLNEFDNLVTKISAWAEIQHRENGTHNFAPSGFDLVPVGGTIQWHTGLAAPTNWLLCNGAAVSRTRYPLLFKVIGIIYGAGDGINTFTLPSLNGGTPKYIILACA